MLATGAGVALGVRGGWAEEEGSLEDFFAEKRLGGGGGVGAVEKGAGHVGGWGWRGSHGAYLSMQAGNG